MTCVGWMTDLAFIRGGIQANRAGTKGFRAPEILLRQVNQTGGKLQDPWDASWD